MARKFQKNAKRSDRPNPRQERNNYRFPNFIVNDPTSTAEENPLRGGKGKKVELIPRNLAQEGYIEALLNPDKHIVFAMGPAGCGKTLLATQFAIKGLQDGTFERIVITRPAVSVDEQHGFLPGSLIEKMQPWMMPILDVFKEHYSPRTLQHMIEDEVVEIAPLAFMRGRTFKRCLVLGDETQNATPNQMKMLLTRIGEGSRMLITGDITQHDRGFEHNGLKDFVERYTDHPNMSVVNFHAKDVERHPLIEHILAMYNE